MDKFVFLESKYAFDVSDNVTLYSVRDVDNLFLSLKVNYEEQLYEQVLVSIYNSYNDFKSKRLDSYNDDFEYLINKEEEVFLLKLKDEKIAWALYGYVYEDDFIVLSFTNDYYIDIELENMKEVFNLCKDTISLNNGYLSIGEKLKNYYLFDEYRIKDNFDVHIYANGFIIDYYDNDIQYEIKIDMEMEEIYDYPYDGVPFNIGDFIIKLNPSEIDDSYLDVSVIMEKNGQTVNFFISRWNSDKKFTADEMYKIFNAIFSK